MSLEKKLFTLVANSREEARRKVVNEFLDEKFGTGNGDLSSKYEYTVESFNNYHVVLKRPAPLNKGFDFVVYTPSIYYKTKGKRRHQNPSHNDIVQILSKTKTNIGDKSYEPIKKLIGDIFDLNDFNIEIANGILFSDADGKEHPLAILLLAIRWLFIEQDITYWNTSGRSMLMNHLMGEGLAIIEPKR
ncbi:MAG: hypothetical protein J6K22_00860 [Spirochaetaceae bacterium]|nr:hypothetical protein [Spirochaetaceae bacterium]